MKNACVDIDFNEVLQRIEKEMEGYSRTEWANKVGVKINVVSNIHGANARQKPSLNYILAVSVDFSSTTKERSTFSSSTSSTSGTTLAK